MTQRKTTSARTAASAETKDELHVAAELVMERERKRKIRAKIRARREQQKRERAQLAAVERMQKSIEVIKWCIVGIATVMFLGIVIGVWTLIQVQAEVKIVQSYVDDIGHQVEGVKEKLSHPMESMGSLFGRELDDKIKQYVGQKIGTGDQSPQ